MSPRHGGRSFAERRGVSLKVRIGFHASREDRADIMKDIGEDVDELILEEKGQIGKMISDVSQGIVTSPEPFRGGGAVRPALVGAAQLGSLAERRGVTLKVDTTFCESCEELADATEASGKEVDELMAQELGQIETMTFDVSDAAWREPFRGGGAVRPAFVGEMTQVARRGSFAERRGVTLKVDTISRASSETESISTPRSPCQPSTQGSSSPHAEVLVASAVASTRGSSRV